MKWWIMYIWPGLVACAFVGVAICISRWLEKRRKARSQADLDELMDTIKKDALYYGPATRVYIINDPTLQEGQED